MRTHLDLARAVVTELVVMGAVTVELYADGLFEITGGMDSDDVILSGNLEDTAPEDRVGELACRLGITTNMVRVYR